MTNANSQYYWITPSDSRSTVNAIWFYNQKNQRRELVHQEFEQFRCQHCKKVDEYAALNSGAKLKRKFKSKVDFTLSTDDVAIVTDRFRNVIEENGVVGVKFIPATEEGGSYFMTPLTVAPTNEEICRRNGMVLDGRCDGCSRYRETSGGWPLANSFNVERKTKVCFSPSLVSESSQGRRFMFYVSADVKGLLTDQDITGIDSFYSL